MVFEKVREILCDQLDLEPEDITLDTKKGTIEVTLKDGAGKAIYNEEVLLSLNGANYTDADIKRLIAEYNVQFIKLQFVDINGQVKNLAVPSEHIDRVLNNDIMLDGSSIKGFRNIETSDMFFYPDKNTFQILPWQERDGKNSARLICDIYNADGTPFEGCPRCNLKRLMAEAQKLGLSMNIGPEAEFFLFEKDEEDKITTKTHDKAGYYDAAKAYLFPEGVDSNLLAKIDARVDPKYLLD